MSLPSRTCDSCHRERSISDRAWLENVQRNAGRYTCRWCRVIVSPVYQETRNTDFGANPHCQTSAAIAKRAASQRGKFGENAQAWKGGKRSLNAQVKAAVMRRHRWHRHIYEHDGWKCTTCGSTKHLDAHHLVPFSVLLKSITPPSELVGDARVDWFANHPTLVEAEGTTLCRTCHKAVHNNWGSHYAEVSS